MGAKHQSTGVLLSLPKETLDEATLDYFASSSLAAMAIRFLHHVRRTDVARGWAQATESVTPDGSLEPSLTHDFLSVGGSYNGVQGDRELELALLAVALVYHTQGKVDTTLFASFLAEGHPLARMLAWLLDNLR